jgi:hypothetical protein
MIKMPLHMAVTPAAKEWMDARGIRLFKNQMIIPSRCQHLGAEQIGIEAPLFGFIVGSGAWVCACRIQDKKPLECRLKGCIKNQYPGIDAV